MDDCIVPIYDPFTVLLSVGIAFIGAYITICLCELLRQKKLPKPLPSVLLNEWGIIVVMAVSLGGIAIWSMHFVGMSSMKLYNPAHQIISVKYNAWQTSLSLIVVVLMSIIGLYISSLDEMFGKSKQEIIDIYVNHASKMSIAEARKISPMGMIWIISTHSLGHLVCGGVVAGSGMTLMHYLGMWALQFEGGHIVWSVGIISTSVLIAIFGSTMAFWILFRPLSLYANWESLRVLSAAVMTVAVCGMHYTGMKASSFRHGSDKESSSASDRATTFTSVEDVALILSFILLIVVIIEVRSQHFRLSQDRSKALNFNASFRAAPRLGQDLESSQRSASVSRRKEKKGFSLRKKFSEFQVGVKSQVLPYIVTASEEVKSSIESGAVDPDRTLAVLADEAV